MAPPLCVHRVSAVGKPSSFGCGSAALIEVPDREAALRVQKILGEKCDPLTSTLLEYRATAIEPGLRKAVSKEGLFLGEPPGPPVNQLDPN